MISTDREQRRGFTLIELMVTVGIIAILVGIGLPAVQAAREAARTTQCASNMRQLMIAIMNYEASWHCFPPGSVSAVSRSADNPGAGVNCSGLALILPYAEESALYNSINFQATELFLSDISPINTTVSVVCLAVFTCPSDRNSGSAGSTNMRFSCGVDSGYDGYFNGVFEPNRSRSFSDLQKGSSNMAGISEKLVGSGSLAGHSARSDWVERNDLLGRSLSPEAWALACSQLTSFAPVRTDGGRTWLLGGAIYTSFFSSLPPNTPIVDCGHTQFFGTGIFSARSNHFNGVNVGLMDGSVRKVSSLIDVNVWSGMSIIY